MASTDVRRVYRRPWRIILISNLSTIIRGGLRASCHRIPIGLVSLHVLCISLTTQVFAADDLQSEDADHAAGKGSVSIAYQNISVNKFNTGVRDVDIGEVLTHSLYVEINYALTDRWQITAGLPFIKKRYVGPGQHDPLTLDPPRPYVPFLDDGSYHSDFQDFFVGINYLWRTDPVIVEPFVNLYIPSNNYPHFAQAAVGQNLFKLEVGVDLTKYMPFSYWYYRVGTSYTFAEKTLGVSVNHFRLDGEMGYFFTQSFSANLFVQSKFGEGDPAGIFPPSMRTDERWYQHDRTTKHNFANVGIGADWFFADKYQLYGSAFTTVWGDAVHLVDLAWSIGMSRYF